MMFSVAILLGILGCVNQNIPFCAAQDDFIDKFDVHNASVVGYPLYFASFENVGEGIVENNITPLPTADDLITEWTRNCPTDAYILIRDHNRYDPFLFKRLQRQAEHSLTRGSLLTDDVVDLEELALDLTAYCEAELVRYDTYSDPNITTYTDTKARVFLVDIVENLEPSLRNLVLDEIIKRIPSPFATIIYASTVQHSKPILRSVKVSPQRVAWTNMRMSHDKSKIAPVIAPLFDVKGSVEEPLLELPDNFFLTLLLGSVVLVVFLVYRDYVAWKTKKHQEQLKALEEKAKASAQINKE